MEDKTAQFTQEDIQANKVISILSYIGILFLVPLLAQKESRFARFHANQGLVLFIVELIVSVLTGILTAVLPVLAIVGSLLGLAVAVLAIIGIVGCAQGTAKTLPVIGAIEILK